MLVLEIVTDSLRLIGIIGETKDPSAEQGQDGVRRLNDMMFSLAEDDIDLGWNTKATTADTVTLQLGHVGAIKALLAVDLASSYGVEVPQKVALDAANGYKRLLRQGIQAVMAQTRLHVLPRGNAQTATNRILTDQS